MILFDKYVALGLTPFKLDKEMIKFLNGVSTMKRNADFHKDLIQIYKDISKMKETNSINYVAIFIFQMQFVLEYDYTKKRGYRRDKTPMEKADYEAINKVLPMIKIDAEFVKSHQKYDLQSLVNKKEYNLSDHDFYTKFIEIDNLFQSSEVNNFGEKYDKLYHMYDKYNIVSFYTYLLDESMNYELESEDVITKYLDFIAKDINRLTENDIYDNEFYYDFVKTCGMNNEKLLRVIFKISAINRNMHNFIHANDRNKDDNYWIRYTKIYKWLLCNSFYIGYFYNIFKEINVYTITPRDYRYVEGNKAWVSQGQNRIFGKQKILDSLSCITGNNIVNIPKYNVYFALGLDNDYSFKDLLKLKGNALTFQLLKLQYPYLKFDDDWFSNKYEYSYKELYYSIQGLVNFNIPHDTIQKCLEGMIKYSTSSKRRSYGDVGVGMSLIHDELLKVVSTKDYMEFVGNNSSLFADNFAKGGNSLFDYSVFKYLNQKTTEEIKTISDKIESYGSRVSYIINKLINYSNSWRDVKLPDISNESLAEKLLVILQFEKLKDLQLLPVLQNINTYEIEDIKASLKYSKSVNDKKTQTPTRIKKAKSLEEEVADWVEEEYFTEPPCFDAKILKDWIVENQNDHDNYSGEVDYNVGDFNIHCEFHGKYDEWTINDEYDDTSGVKASIIKEFRKLLEEKVKIKGYECPLLETII